MDTPITIGILAGCAALALILVLLSLHILRKESVYLRERSRNGEILLLLSGMIGGKVAADGQEPCAPAPAPAQTANMDSSGKAAAPAEISPSNQPSENG